MVASLFLALLLGSHIQAAPHDGATGIVHGRVLSEDTRRPLAYAQIRVIGLAPTVAAMTDSLGGYVLRGVPAGRRLLRAQHIDHASHDVEIIIPENGAVSLDIELAVRPVVLSRVMVRSLSRAAADTMTAPAPELGAAAVHVLESSPGMAELGLAQAIRDAPGHEPVDPSDALYVRGAASDLKLVLLDGAPVYAPFHLGGLINAFEPGVLNSADLYIGGAPARFDGGLSYVLALETRAGREEFRTEGAIDLLSGRAQAEGPIGTQGRFILSGRAIHDLAALRFLAHKLPYAYQDGLGRIDIDLGGGTSLGMTGFWNHEAVSLDTMPTEARDASWGNAAGSIRVKGPLGRSDAAFTVAYGAFEAQLPIGGERPLLVDGTAHRTRFNFDIARVNGRTAVEYGFSYERLWLLYRAWPRAVAPDSLLLQEEEVGSVGGAYLDGSWQPGNRFRLRGGMRGDIFSLSRPIRLSPRASATWLLTDRSALTLAAGRYNQYVRASEPDIVSPQEDSTASNQPPPPPLSLASSSHIVLALDQELLKGLRLGVETYYKRYEGIPAARGRHSEASGAELRLRRSAGSLTGWLGYSLAWLWSESADDLASEFLAGRHLVSFGLAGPLGPQGNFDIRFAYGAGLPFTAVPEPVADGTDFQPLPYMMSLREPVPQTRGPREPYVRLDASISHSWQVSFGGAEGELTPYVKVINALDRRDGLFYRNDGNGDEPDVIAAIPILPVLGLQWNF